MTSKPYGEHRDIIASALKEGASDCDGKCGRSERECADTHQVLWGGTARKGKPDEVTWVEGTTVGIADVILAAYEAAGLTLIRKPRE